MKSLRSKWINSSIIFILFSISFCFLPSIARTENAQKMYWVDFGLENFGHQVRRSDLDGSNIETLVSFGSDANVASIALDVDSDKIYWTDDNYMEINRASLDGLQIENVLSFEIDVNPIGIALDLNNGKMYWTEVNTGRIRRADIDGSNLEVLVANLDCPVSIALDVSSGKMYWTDTGDTDEVFRANMDGSGITVIVTNAGENTGGITLDPANGKVYWSVNGKIRRANLDGSSVEDLIDVMIPGEDVTEIPGIALDVNDGRIYWTEADRNRIRRAKLDGSSVEEVLTLGADANPRAIALDLGPQYHIPPTADAGEDQTIILGETVYFDGSGSSDSDGEIVSYEWEFEDGIIKTGENTSYVYCGAGEYGVTLTITDDDGATNTDTITVTVETPEQASQNVGDELYRIIEDNPDRPLADKIEDALAKVQAALDELTKNPPDNQAAVGNIEGAVGDLEAAVKDGLLDPVQGEQLMDQLARITRALATCVLLCEAVDCNEPEIDEAWQYLTKGDSLRDSGMLKDSINKYKDSLSKAESALQSCE